MAGSFYLSVFLGLAHFALSLAGAFFSPAAGSYYFLFSTSFLVMLLSAFYGNKSPSYIFFACMLWLGFFGKTIVHWVLKYSFHEPVGYFSFKADQWDQVLLVASIGAIACFTTKLLLDRFFHLKQNPFLLNNIEISTSVVFNKYKFVIFFLFIAFALSLAIFNFKFGINLSGLAAVTILPFPLNAAIGWLLYIGFAIIAAQLSHWEYTYERTARSGFTVSLFAALSSSISILSRGLFLFHAIPIILVNLINKQKLNIGWGKSMIILTLAFLGFFFNSYQVTALREPLFNNDSFMYDFYDDEDYDALLFEITELKYNSEVVVAVPSPLPVVKTTETATKQIITDAAITQAPIAGSAFSAQAVKADNKIIKTLKMISTLAIDRWVGIEGVMAVVGYPKKDTQLLTNSLLRNPEIGELDVYETIANSIYQPSMKYSFASIPGPIAMFFYSNSLFIVFAGLSFFTLVMCGLDRIIHSSFRNAFLSTQLGFYLANSLAQFGLSPMPLLKSFLMTAIALAMLKFVTMQSQKFFSTKLQ